jgi:hypothetical protein
LEARVSDCAPWDTVRNIYKELGYYIKVEDFEIHRLSIMDGFTRIDEKTDTLIGKNEAI